MKSLLWTKAELVCFICFSYVSFMKPRIVAFSISSLEPVLREVSLDYLAQASIEIVPKAYEEALTYARQRYQTDTVDVFVGAGSNGAFLKGQLEAPLVVLQTDGFDLMRALASARQVADLVGLVSYEQSYEELGELKAAFGMTILTRVYRTPEDARQAVRDLASAGVGAIVGPGLVNEIAQEYGIESVLSYSRGAVARSFEEAIRLASAKLGQAGRLSPASTRYSTADLLGDSPPMQQLRQHIRLFANTDCSVLIQGETGTGKELVAQSLHASSQRVRQPFIAINCGALSESLLESELFGYEEGAFSGAVKGGRAGIFEAAHRGTVFLDEIGDMPLPFQTRLLRVLEEGAVRRVGATRSRQVDFRLLAATHRPLASLVADGGFREDLYHRLNELFLTLPSLAQRPEDIQTLTGHFLRTSAVRVPKERFDQFLDVVCPVFAGLPWPGNVRQLKQMCRRAAVLLSQSPCEDAAQLQQWFPDLFVERLGASDDVSSGGFSSLSERDRLLAVQGSLKRHGGKVSQAAQHLGISRSTLWRYSQRLAPPA